MHTVELEGTAEPIPVGKIICIGRNYAEHAREMKSDVPQSPIFFLKPSTALVADGGTVLIPSISRNVHHEVELTVLIGTTGKNIPPASALGYVAGYGVGLDMTLRDVQDEAKNKGLPWSLAKGFDTSAPVSRFVAAREVPHPESLEVELSVNGAVRQRATTDRFIFSVERLLAYLSQFMTLERGDIIFTGTPEGVDRVKTGDQLVATLKKSTHQTLASLSVRVQ
jgi:5-carboxymethyl-2-hydroxymuconate isomerase